jgi:hypothetical protein
LLMWARGTRAVAASAHSSDRQSDIHGPLLLPPTIVMDSMILEDRCYCRACGIRTVADSAHSNDGSYDINGPFLLCGMWHTHGCF